MPLSRRTLLVAGSIAPAFASTLARSAFADTATDPRLATRTLGNPKAKVTIEEWFSLTCTHCAHFAATVFPDVKTKLIDTGDVYYVFRDFPLDRIALMAAMVARGLPADRYEPFVLSLFASQDRWAFNQEANPEDELRKMAALAGMSADLFDRTVNDTGLQKAILDAQDQASSTYQINSTPTFRFNGTIYPFGELTYDAFAAKVKQAGG